MRSIETGDCRRAVAGGINLLHSISGWTWLARTRALAPDGQCKAFDARADGYGRGEGCVAVVLAAEGATPSPQRYYGQCLGTAVNQAGRTASLTAPSGPSQVRVWLGPGQWSVPCLSWEQLMDGQSEGPGQWPHGAQGLLCTVSQWVSHQRRTVGLMPQQLPFGDHMFVQ